MSRWDKPEDGYVGEDGKVIWRPLRSDFADDDFEGWSRAFDAYTSARDTLAAKVFDKAFRKAMRKGE